MERLLGLVKVGTTHSAGSELPFSRAAVYFVHQINHTDLDRQELIQWAPSESYWINNRPFADERHWDNMGFEVVNDFSSTFRP